MLYQVYVVDSKFTERVHLDWRTKITLETLLRIKIFIILSYEMADKTTEAALIACAEWAAFKCFGGLLRGESRILVFFNSISLWKKKFNHRGL